MTRLVIAICTYERPDGLERLLTALEHQRVGSLAEGSIEILVVDNSATGGARDAVAARALTSGFRVEYRHQPRKGLSTARNTGVAAAREMAATHLAFVDDDEMPAPGWIDALYRRLIQTGASAAVGPVQPLFAAPPPRNLPVEAFHIRAPTAGGLALEGYTCNALIDMAVFADADQPFDPRNDEIGGEDTLFFARLAAKGGTIAWAEDALVHELVPTDRMTARWLFRRWFRTGSVEAMLCPYGWQSGRAKAVNLTRGGARIGAGVLRLAAATASGGWWRPDRIVASAYTVCRGLGMISNVLGRDYREYARRNYR